MKSNFFSNPNANTAFCLPISCRVRNATVVSHINVIFEIVYNWVKAHLVDAIMDK